MLLEADGCRAHVLPEAGGRLASLEIDGWQLLVPTGADEFHWGNFVIAPWAGRLRHGVLGYQGAEHHLPVNAPPHALHGLVTNVPWQEEGPGRVAVDLPEPWPWRGRLTHAMRLAPGRLDFRIELRVEQPMPASLGWHPWFNTWIGGPGGRTAGPIDLDVRPRSMYANDDEGMPTGVLVPPVPRPWDYCFTGVDSPPVVRWPHVLEMTIESSCSDWVIYDREPQGLCVEPWTAPPNALNMAVAPVVTPEAPLVATMTWRWRRIP